MISAKQAVLLIAVLIAVNKWREERKAEQRKRMIQEAVKAKGYSVGIIGGGVGGIATAKKCMDLGIPFHIYEMAHDFGGTWLYNTCELDVAFDVRGNQLTCAFKIDPGCACDVSAHCYSFSWAPNPDCRS